MALFVEVTSVEKNCPVIINLDHILEIAPLVQGGCALFMTDAGGVNTKSTVRVKEDYNMFKQFAMQTVTSEDIEKRFPKKKQPDIREELKNISEDLEIPTLGGKKK